MCYSTYKTKQVSVKYITVKGIFSENLYISSANLNIKLKIGNQNWKYIYGCYINETKSV